MSTSVKPFDVWLAEQDPCVQRVVMRYVNDGPLPQYLTQCMSCGVRFEAREKTGTREQYCSQDCRAAGKPTPAPAFYHHGNLAV